VNTYSLAEVAAFLCGDSMKNPQRWVTEQILAGRFQAMKIGRTWRMTQVQLDEAVTLLSSPKPRRESAANGLSAGSARRRLGVA
jgi:hypothetical protein